jgi:hypothetical protein
VRGRLQAEDSAKSLRGGISSLSRVFECGGVLHRQSRP